jgi:uncharacterized phiE125 gp8 family phage protein
MPRAYTYEVIEEPVELAVSLDDVKAHLRLDPADTSQDAYLELLIRAATRVAEDYTRRTFINTTFRTYRDFFENCTKLRRSRFQSLVSFEYSVADALTTVNSSLYYITDETGYSKIILKDSESYPDDIDDKLDSIKIDFVAGFGADSSSIPRDLYLALLNHIAVLYENRGDCDQDMSDDFWEKNLPSASRLIYTQNRLLDLHDGCI